MNAYGCDGIADADVERELGFGPDAVDENEIERELEERAEREVANCAPAFHEWLFENPDQARQIAIAACYWPTGKYQGGPRDGTWWSFEDSREQREDNISDARRQLERDYIAYRVNSAPEWEREEIAASIRADREAA